MVSEFSELVRRAVYRSLDTLSGAIYDHSGMDADSRLRLWRDRRLSDDQILAEIVGIYAYNPSMRSKDDPFITVKSDYVVKKKGVENRLPVLWVSEINHDSVFKLVKGEWVFTKPDIVGFDIVSIVRQLMEELTSADVIASVGEFEHEWAIDFETATGDRGTPCSVGLVEVSGLAVGRQEYKLIRPEPLKFAEWNTRIHGIGASDVKNAPPFKEIWPALSVSNEWSLLLAHSAEFEASVLRKCLSAARIPLPKASIVCTLELAQAAFPGLRSYSLPLVAAHLGISHQHHHALSDANVSAGIGIAVARMLGVSTVREAAAKLGVGIRRLDGADATVVRPGGQHLVERQEVKTVLALPGRRLDGKAVAITGELLLCTRSEAQQLIEEAGGVFHPRVRKDTDWLIVGAAAGAKADLASLYKEKYGKPDLTDENGFRDLLGIARHGQP